MDRPPSARPDSSGESRAFDDALALDVRAVALLELGACAAHGEVVLAGRRIHLEQGQVTDVLGAPGDTALANFLRESGRVPEDWLQRHADISDERRLEAELERDGVLGENDVRAVRRSLWIERLAAALDDAMRAGEDAPRLGAPPAGMRQGRGSRMVPLVLDALARLAGDGAAEDVGARLTHRVRWSGGVHEPQARTWAGFGDVPEHPAIASVLARRPAAASRIAALTRLGLVELDAPGLSLLVPAATRDTLPPPLPRRSLVPTARPLPLAKPRASLPPARMPRLRLDPGAAEVVDEPLAPTPLRTFVATDVAWDDPLWTCERDIAALEAQGAPGPVRAQAFRTLAITWRERLGSLDEAARAYREAVAADATDATLLCETAACCLAAGDARLALQFADVAVTAADTPTLRATARRLRARLYATLGKVDACVENLCEAVADDPSDVEAHEHAAAILAARADAAGANAHLRLAAAGHGAGPRALALLRHAADLRPDHIATTQELAAALVTAGLAPAACVVWLQAARRQRVPAGRRRLRATAAEVATAHGCPNVATDALADEIDASPSLDLQHEPLDPALRDANVAAIALRLDPPDARAADLLLHHPDRMATSEAPALLRLAQSALGASRTLFQAQAAAALAANDRPAQRAALQAWCALLPCDPEAARALLACEREGDDAAAVEHAAERVLQGLVGREMLAATGDAVDRLLARGTHEEGLRLLLRVGQSLGRSGGPLATRALELAKTMSSPVAIEALEWAAAQPDPAARAEALAHLARVHRERADLLGETRALQRLLQATPERADVFERLESLWIASGARARLAPLYAFGAETASAPEVRARRLSDLVAASADDPERAAAHVRTLLIEEASDLGAVRTAAGLLFSLGDNRWAIAHCEAIAPDCPEEAGGKVALWTVMTAEYVLGDSVLAREIAMRGAQRFPNEAGLLLLAERLALASEDVVGALATYDALLAAAIGPHGRRTLQYRAGRWLERAGQPGEALVRFLEAFALAPSMGVAYRAAERLAEAASDHRTLERLYTTLATATRDVALRFTLTRRIANLLLDRLDETERGYATLLEANALSEHFDLDDELHERARALTRENAPTALAAREALRAHWEERVESLWESRARIACLRKLAVLLAEDFADVPGALACLERASGIAAEEQVEELPRADLERELGALRARLATEGGEPPARRSYVGVAPGARASRVAALDVHAPTSSTAASGATLATAPADTREDLVAAVHAEPWRVDVLRRLHALQAPASPALGIVVGALLSVIDGGADAEPASDFTHVWRGHALDEIIGPTYPDALGNLLSLLWQRARALPRFRIALEAYGVSSRDRLTRLSMGFVSDAYADAAQALGIHIPVYTSDTAPEPVRALPTYPSCLVCTPDMGGSPSERTYALSRALWLTRGEHVIAALLDEPDARLLLDAFVAAFGTSRPEAIADRERKELAAQFWQTIPARDQQALSTLVRAHASQLDYPTLRATAYAAAARAGLLVCGDIGVALRATLAEAGVSPAPLDAASFEAACRASASVAEVVRCALSPAFLDATARSRGMF